MATNQNTANERVVPPNAEALGVNFGVLSRWSAVFIALAAVVFAVFFFGYWVSPFEQLEANPLEPLRQQVPLEVMPALPDELTVFYDGLTEEQFEVLESFGAGAVQEGNVSIPLETAIDLMLENDLFPIATAEEE